MPQQTETATPALFDEPLFAEAVRLHRASRLDEAEPLFRQILAAHPNHALTLHLLGMIAAERGRYEDAAGLIERSLALAPEVAEAHYNLGVALGELKRPEEAVAAYRRALTIKPNVAETHRQLSIALQELGDSAEARVAADRAVALDPSSPRAWFVRADLKTFAPQDPDLERLEALAARGRMTDEDRTLLEFALAKAWMDAGDPDRAFAHVTRANRRKRAGFAYDVEADARWFHKMAEALSEEVISRWAGAGEPSDLPVFVVGIPRSGTTLVEQILASHPQVHGAGELLTLEEVLGRDWARDDLAEVSLRAAEALDAAELARMGRLYVERVSSLARGERRVIDKSPGNFRLLGLISLMLPNAHVIHCRRDPIDTCFSCYTRNFTGRVRYAFDLTELGRYYRAYEGLMAHWRTVLPAERFLEVDYEAVVDDLEGQARRLVSFCGLAWDDACLDFHATKRPVRTISANQVRRPIYRTSVARWKPYERHLGPLLEALGESVRRG